MSDSIAPESRIFRVGRECYIVYLGKERDDIKPFLRIGNTRDIPDEVYDAISTTVVTDDHVGNPLLEIRNSDKVTGRYLGDTFVVGEIRKFFKSFDLPTDEVTDYRKVKDGEKRHMVWFYSSGNIHLRYDDHVIFDLDKREKADRHFIRLYEEAKAEFLRNPLRYIKQDFAGPGMVLSGGNAFWYEAGEMLSLEAHPGFVARLMNDGVDPDFITTSCFDLDAETMDTHDAAVFIGYVKRTRQRRKQLRVLTTKPELQRKLRLLFPTRGDVPATLDVTDVSGKKKATFRESIVSYRDDTWMIHRAGLPEVSIGGKPENGISIDVPQGVISVHRDGVETRVKTPRGCPIDFMRGALPESQLVEKYIGMVYSQCKSHLGPGEAAAAAAVEKYVRMLRDDIAAGKASASPLLKQTAGAARDGVKKAQIPEGAVSWYFYSNALTVLEHLQERAGEEHPLSKNAEPAASALRNLISRAPAPDPVHPFWADLYFEKSPRLLWRAAKRSYVPADIGAADAVNEKIAEITRLDEAPWGEDRERLLKLIRSLRDSGKGPLTDEQLALLQKPEKEEPAGEAPKKETSSAPAAASDFSRAGGKDSDRDRDASSSAPSRTDGVRPGSGGRSESGGRRIGLWILLTLLLLLLGGAVAWDLSGGAPWGSVLRSDGVVDDGERGSEGEIETRAADPDDTGSDSDSDADEPDADATDATDTADTADTDAADSGAADSDAADSDADRTDDGVSADGTTDGAPDGGTDNDGAGSTGDTQADPESFDPDVAPETTADFDKYITITDEVVISLADIHLAANEIAVLNGYKDLDFRVYTGADPDWIYPGNLLKLPGGENYTVRRGDTIWFLAAREVRVDVTGELRAYADASAILDDPGSSDADRSEALDVLRSIADSSRAEDMRALAAAKLSNSQ